MPVQWESWVHAYGEVRTYSVFFGLFGFLALAEVFIPRSNASPERLSRWSVNAALTASWVFAGAFVPVSLLAAANAAAAGDWGLLSWIEAPVEVVLAGGLVARSLTSYATHVVMHKVPLLWRVHRVHHTDTQLDVSTTVRFHPLEAIVTAPFSLVGVFVFGVPPLAVILYEIVDAAIVVLTHANIRIPRWLDISLSLIFVTPNMHRIHHSSIPTETDSNYGATFSLWDHLFRTFRSKSDSDLAALRIGLREVSDPHSRNLFWLLASPFFTLERYKRQAPDTTETGVTDV